MAKMVAYRATRWKARKGPEILTAGQKVRIPQWWQSFNPAHLTNPMGHLTYTPSSSELDHFKAQSSLKTMSLVINKPAGFAVQGAQTYISMSMA